MRAPAVSEKATPSRAADFLSLTKPRITVFVVMTAFVGFAAGVKGPLLSLDPVLLLHTLLGTALVASGTSAFNQIWEIDLDRRMVRTASRPLPAGRLAFGECFAFATLLSVVGVAELFVFANTITAVLAATTLLSYVFAYTPLKTRSPLSTLVGGLPGALPPLGGFTAAHGEIAPIGLVLFALLFLWQLPHFLAIGWRHRADYEAAGVKIIPTLDPTGARTSGHALVYTLALLPVGLLPVYFGNAGLVYGAGTLLATGFFVAASVRFFRSTNDQTALSLFLTSLGWLPAVLLLFVLDRISI